MKIFYQLLAKGRSKNKGDCQHSFPTSTDTHGIPQQKEKRFPFQLTQRPGTRRKAVQTQVPVTFVVHKTEKTQDTKVIQMITSFPQIA